ncbi:hypothetical protein LIA77_03490 [Sarocladium implicatum]|nr:hypothetical protein LIA77_03490 [Sarocladium implicatum]
MDRARRFVRRHPADHRHSGYELPESDDTQILDKQLEEINRDIDRCQELIDALDHEARRLAQLKGADRLWVGYYGSSDVQRQLNETLEQKNEMERMLASFEAERRRIEAGLAEARRRDRIAASSRR